jgi:class 3 adenylate cyclase/DNA-binding transcriptional MerR regulator
MLSSKDVLERTGISRATLNNYISAGLVTRPEVLPPGPQDGGAPRIGYFPDDTIERIETIQRLKREGWSLGRILQFFGERPPAEVPLAGIPETPDSAESAEGAAGAAAGPIAAAAASPLLRSSTFPAAADSPQMMVVAVLAVTLHDADTLWVALSVHDYFALTNEVSGEVRRIVATHGGQVMRVAPHRFVCRFLPRPQGHHLWNTIEAAEAVRDAVREVSGRWKLRRGWDLDILANAGLCEGESWVSAPPQEDVQIVGETLDDAQEMARCARRGALLVTRSLIGRLPEDVRRRVVYGVPAPDQHEGAPARLMSFTRLREFAQPGGLSRRLAALPVTEIVELRASADTAQRKEAE